MRNKLFIAWLFISLSTTIIASDPVVSNVMLVQRTDGSGIADITYDLTWADGNLLNVFLTASDDDGGYWDFSCSQVSGDVGGNISTGTGKTIVWQFAAEHPNTFSTEFKVKVTAEAPIITDIDGNVYETVVIGDQIWMAENLKVTRYRNGEAIPTGYSNSEWLNLDDTETDAYCVPSNADTYGYLYNWYAVDDSRNIAPEGWHIPTDEEWMELEMALGMSESEANYNGMRGTDQGSQLAGRADLWNNGVLENNANFGTSGFNALPGGARSYGGNYDSMGTHSYFWSSTEYGSTTAWFRGLNSNDSEVYRYNHPKQYGFSVRCIRD